MIRRKGFTLIELLVVIAIIGILSSVVLASLNTARGRGADANIKSNLSNIRAQAELYYDSPAPAGNGTYGATSSSCSPTAGTLFADAQIAAMLTSSESTNGAGTMNCRSTASAWSVSSPLVGDSGGHWCVSSNGDSKRSASATVTAGICP
jgi:prepilin-type N-terminal cleavage/methylation domain-containing protein